MIKNFKRVSSRYAKSQFMTIGLVLTIYILMVLYIPMMFFKLVEANSINMMNPNLMVGVVYACNLIGTLLPFYILKSSFNIKINDFWKTSAFKFKDIIVYAVVFIALTSALVFLSSIINSYIPIGENILVGIIYSLDINYLKTPLFGLLFCIGLPLVEELAFRGVLLRALGRYGNRFAGISCALIYALFQPNFSTMLAGFFMALYLINITLRYKSVTPAIIIHMAFNIFVYLFEFVPSNYLFIATLFLFVIYLLALFFILTRKYIYAKVKKSTNISYTYKLFFSRFSVLLALFLALFYSFLSFVSAI